MNHRELLLSALAHRETNPVPYTLGFTQQALTNLLSHVGDPLFVEKLNADILGVDYSGWPVELPGRPGFFKDDFGVVWNRSGADKDIGTIDFPQITDLEKSGYAFPVCDEARLRGEYEAMMAGKNDKFTAAVFGFCMFERAWSLMGMENVLMSMITCPDALEDLFDRICEYYMRLVDIALEYDIDAVHFGDDWGQQRGLIMGVSHWRRFIKPRMAKLFGRVREKGKYVIHHSCGDIGELFPELIEIGLNCYQTFQPEIYDISEVKRRYGGKLTFWGGVSTQRLLPVAQPDEVRAETARIIRVMKPGGGLIIAPTHAITFDTPPENILAMLDVFQNQDKYI